MILRACYIHNFGKLRDVELSFAEGMNVICEDNGWGKSTLAAFIKAMLYGLDKKKKNAIAEDERKKYKPWQGGVFGGKLVFETGGKVYAVTRQFGDTPSKDFFELRDNATHLPSSDFSERLGEELFGIDSNSFYRSIFIGQSDCLTDTTDDIHAKIGNLADATGDLNSYESAMDLLKKQINKLTPDRKTGSLSSRAEKLASLRRSIQDGSGLPDRLSEAERMLSEERSALREKTASLHSLEATQDKVILSQQVIRLREEWTRLQAARDALREELEGERAAFPGEMPTMASVKETLQRAEQMRSAASVRDSHELSKEEMREAARLAKVFASRVPSKEEIDGYLAEEQMLRQTVDQYERLRLSPQENERLRKLTRDFEGEADTPAEMTALWNERRSKKDALASKRHVLSALIENAETTRNDRIRHSLMLLASGAAILLAGLTVFVTASRLWGILLSVAGAAVLSVGTIRYFKRKNLYTEDYFSDDTKRLRDEVATDIQLLKQMDSRVERYFIAHGREFDEERVWDELQEIAGEYYDWQQLKRKAACAAAYAAENDFSALEESLRDFLSEFGIGRGSGFSDSLYGLKNAADRFASLSEKKRRYVEADFELKRESVAIRQFLTSYGMSEETDIQATLERMRDGLVRYADLAGRLEAAEAALADFESRHDTGALTGGEGEEALPTPEEAAEAVRECNAALGTLRTHIEALIRETDALNEQVAQREANQADYERLRALQEEERTKYERLVKAEALLRRAKENMTARYVAPIRESFRKYFELLAEMPADSYLIDANINVTVEEQGQQRDVRALSAGYRDMTGFCLRLALADAMYRGEKPVLIMDDPFTNLDDGKVAASKQLLEAASAEYQILYFTCSRSRQ